MIVNYDSTVEIYYRKLFLTLATEVESELEIILTETGVTKIKKGSTKSIPPPWL